MGNVWCQFMCTPKYSEVHGIQHQINYATSAPPPPPQGCPQQFHRQRNILDQNRYSVHTLYIYFFFSLILSAVILRVKLSFSTLNSFNSCWLLLVMTFHISVFYRYIFQLECYALNAKVDESCRQVNKHYK
jgi:hypothetical protein